MCGVEFHGSDYETAKGFVEFTRAYLKTLYHGRKPLKVKITAAAKAAGRKENKMNAITMNGYKRISKAAARKAYENGETLRIVPCKVAPVNAWGIGFNECKAEGEAEYPGRFEKIINALTWYNCNNYVGNYLAYYIKTE